MQQETITKTKVGLKTKVMVATAILSIGALAAFGGIWFYRLPNVYLNSSSPSGQILAGMADQLLVAFDFGSGAMRKPIEISEITVTIDFFREQTGQELKNQINDLDLFVNDVPISKVAELELTKLESKGLYRGIAKFELDSPLVIPTKSIIMVMVKARIGNIDTLGGRVRASIKRTKHIKATIYSGRRVMVVPQRAWGHWLEITDIHNE